jgi:hypothetical protein
MNRIPLSFLIAVAVVMALSIAIYLAFVWLLL